MLHTFAVSFQGLVSLTFGVLDAMWVVRVVARLEARIERYMAAARKRRIKFVVEGSYAQARSFVRSQGWNQGEWKYLSQNDQLARLANVTIYQAGEYWLNPVATKVDFWHAYAGVKLVKETAADEASTGSAA